MKYVKGMIAPNEIIEQIITMVGDNPRREGLIETPARVVRSWEELYAGYDVDVSSIFKTFTDGKCDEMVILKNVSFFSMCEHHMLPFHGTISIGYVPSGRIIGISKLARLIEIYARRLQVQERMTKEIANTLMKNLKPKGVMVVCEAQHLCMIARGVKKHNATMVTSAIRGVYTDDKVRSEFINLIK